MLTARRTVLRPRCCLTNKNVLFSTFDHLELVDLRRATQVCRLWGFVGASVLYGRVRRELRRNIWPDLQAYALSRDANTRAIPDFLNLLDATGSVVSGSTALAVCMKGTKHAGAWMDTGDLDVFTPRGQAARVSRDISMLFGFSVQFRADCSFAFVHGDSSYGVCRPIQNGVWSLTRLVGDDGIRKVDVVESSNECAIHPISHFPFTHIVNYLTGSTLVVCYPIHTLLQHRSVANPTNDRISRLKKRYEERNWDIEDSHDDNEHVPACMDPHNYCPVVMRTSEDALCFAFKFKVDENLVHDREVSRYPRAMWMWGEKWANGENVMAQHNYLRESGDMVYGISNLIEPETLQAWIDQGLM